MPAAGWAAAGDRAGGGEDARAQRGADTGSLERPVRPADGWEPGGAAAPSDAADDDRLEPRPAGGGGTDAAAAAECVRGTVHAGGRRGGVWVRRRGGGRWIGSAVGAG